MSDQLIIRTMKDDIAEMNSLPSAAPAEPVLQTEPRFDERPTPIPAPKPEKPKPVKTELEVITPAPNKKRINIAIGIGCILLFFVIIGGAVYAYMRWGTVQTPYQAIEQEASLSQIIPKEALAVIDYNLSTEDNRNQLVRMWSADSEERASEITSGNPTGLLAMPDLGHVSYVIMPGFDSPFVVLKKTEITTQFVSQQSGIKSFEKNGWYILHASNVDQYATALEQGGITEESPLVSSSDAQSYLVRYALSPALVSGQFGSMSKFSYKDGVVFHVLAAASDGALQASAHSAGNSSAEGVSPQTSELISLIPSDTTFTRVGLSFTKDLGVLQQDVSFLDTAILAQPAVRQFTSQFDTPYALFERKGSDGIADIGMVIALPDSLKKNLKIGEPILEQALPALIPLVVGKALGIQVSFSDGLYNAVPVRYVNLVGQQQTLDYSVGDNFLLVSSSREGIYSLIDTSLSGKEVLSNEEPWKSLMEKSVELTRNTSFVVGNIQDPALINVLPVVPNTTQAPIVVSSRGTSTGVDVQAVLSVK